MLMERDILLTMQDDLARALAKPSRTVRWAMLISTKKCVGCHACTVGCMSENVLPPEVIYRPVFEMTSGKYPKVKIDFVPRPCQHCDAPPCVPVCPTNGKATYKSTENGLVMLNSAECISCGLCVEACPYKARTMDGSNYYTENIKVQPYELRTFPEYNGKWQRTDGKSPMSNVRKCSFCLHRLKDGMLPMCVTTCIGRATYFGDINDPESLISKMMKADKTTTIQSIPDAKPKTGKAVFGASKTKPRVFYVL